MYCSISEATLTMIKVKHIQIQSLIRLFRIQWSNCYLFEYEVIYDLLPYMEKNYPVKKALLIQVCAGCLWAVEKPLNWG